MVSAESTSFAIVIAGPRVDVEQTTTLPTAVTWNEDILAARKGGRAAPDAAAFRREPLWVASVGTRPTSPHTRCGSPRPSVDAGTGPVGARRTPRGGRGHPAIRSPTHGRRAENCGSDRCCRRRSSQLARRRLSDDHSPDQGRTSQSTRWRVMAASPAARTGDENPLVQLMPPEVAVLARQRGR